VAKYRIFIWLDGASSIDDGAIAIARDDDTTFGILQSKLHELWSLRMCTWLGVGNDPRYTPTTCFETFPFPENLTPNVPAADYAADPRAIAIAVAAKKLNELREGWLNPSDIVRRVPEVVPGYPDRILPKDDAAAAILKKRTLTNLYNEQPAWLDMAHKELDRAVAAAYGWTDWGADGLPDDVILERLFKLNQERAIATGSDCRGPCRRIRPGRQAVHGEVPQVCESQLWRALPRFRRRVLHVRTLATARSGVGAGAG